MRKLVYRLTDGSVVTTFKEALISGQGYTAEVENIPLKAPKLTPKQALMRKEVACPKN